MNEICQYGISSREKVLVEIQKILIKDIGDKITFVQFIGIMSKDNSLRFFNRNSLLRKRRIFFKGEEKRGRTSGKEISMPLGRFMDFLEFLADDPQIKLDIFKFKKAAVYCINSGRI